jgi:hypothetical protein
VPISRKHLITPYRNQISEIGLATPRIAARRAVRTQISASWRHGACINCLRIRTYAVGRWQCWLESGQPNVADVDQAMATRFGTLLISWSTTSSARASACPSTPSLLFCMASAASVHRETMSHVVAAFWRLPAQWPSRQLSWRRFPAASHAPSSRQPRMLTHGASVHSIDGRIKRAYHGSWVACFDTIGSSSSHFPS